MVDFTREIKAAEGQASQTPQFQAPTGSVVADVANLASTGLQLFQQKQAQEQVVALKQQEQQYNTQLSSAALKLRDLRLSLQAQEVSPIEYQRKEKQLLNSFGGSTFQAEVVNAANKLTGGSSSAAISKLHERQDAEEKAARQQMEDRFNLEQLAVAAAPQYGASINPAEMTDEELRTVVLRGSYAESERNVRIKKLEEDNKLLTNKKQRQDAQSRFFSYEASTQFLNKQNAALGNYITSIGGISNTTAPQVVQYLEQRKSLLRNEFYTEYVRAAQEADLYFSQEDINNAISSAEQGIDSFISMLQGEETLKAIQNNTNIIFEGGLLKGLGSTNENMRNASFKILASNYAKQNLALTDFDSMSKYVANSLSGTLDTTDPVNSVLARKVGDVIIPLRPESGDGWQFTKDLIEGQLGGTSKQQKFAVSSGALDSIVSALANSNTPVADPSDVEGINQTADHIYKLSSKAISAKIAQIVTAGDVRMRSSREGALYQTSRERGYAFDAENNKFVPVGNNVQPNNDIRQLNMFLEKNIKAFKNLGKDDEYIDMFINDILTSLSISPSE